MTDDFVPEADAVEQHQEVTTEDEPAPLDTDVPIDANEADVIEQAQELPDDEAYEAS